MTRKIINTKWIGTRPLITHNGRLADPLDEYTRQLKKLTAIKAKTDLLHEQIARAEWEGGLYFDDKLGPVMPGENIEKCIIQGGRLTKHGKAIERGGIMCTEFVIPLQYKGPRTPDKMWANPAFKFRKRCVVQRKAVMRTRPRFEEWSLDVPLTVDPDLINDDAFREILDNTGQYVGLGEWHPRYGAFTVEVLR